MDRIIVENRFKSFFPIGLSYLLM